MASIVVNTPGTPVVVRNRPTNLGSLAAATNVVQFVLAIPTNSPNGNDLLTVVAAAGSTNVVALEASLDGGTTWFAIVAGSQAATFNTTTLNSDTAAGNAASFNISGLQGALFRAGVTGTFVATAIWVLLG